MDHIISSVFPDHFLDIELYVTKIVTEKIGEANRVTKETSTYVDKNTYYQLLQDNHLGSLTQLNIFYMK